MSKLTDIITDATAAAYCAGQDWSKVNPTTEKVDKASSEAEEKTKALMVEIFNRVLLQERPSSPLKAYNKLCREVREL